MKCEKEETFIEAVRDGSPKMYRVALGFLHSPQDAQDAVSDAIEAAWKNLGRIRRSEAIPAYLIRCTINAARTVLRKRRRLEPLEPYRNTLAAGETGDPIVYYLSGMKERDQLLLILKYQEELRDAEIGSILHMTRGGVSSQISRLLKKLREEMEEHD